MKTDDHIIMETIVEALDGCTIYRARRILEGAFNQYRYMVEVSSREPALNDEEAAQ